MPDPEALDAATRLPPASFIESVAELGVAFEPGDTERLGLFLAYLLWANERINLTAIRDPAQAWTRHILDALTLLGPLSQLPPGAAVIDIGSGGGLPGIPLAITLPRVRFTLLEATGKKARFLEQVAARLQLPNVEIVNDRAEQAGAEGSALRGRFDAAVARAVGHTRVVAELALPLTRVGGLTLLVKGPRAAEELVEAKRALHALHAAHVGTITTPTGRIVVLEKLRATPACYPRRTGEPGRAPL
ncbi:MAG: 16S rRNA (guanine(527)-N(7))-methyltransferase RsmG [Planctomycetes bacterium]|nr:16S rRNA (guanine(527)-N(7))-methyltransferase RsmG [Planctomycetota bacterium]